MKNLIRGIIYFIVVNMFLTLTCLSFTPSVVNQWYGFLLFANGVGGVIGTMVHALYHYVIRDNML